METTKRDSDGFVCIEVPDFEQLTNEAFKQKVFEIEDASFYIKLKVDDVTVEGVPTKCLGVFLSCQPEYEKAKSEWICVVSTEVMIGDCTKKFNHKFTPKESEWGFANFALWDHITNDLDDKEDKVLIVKTKVRALPLKVEETAAPPKEHGAECLERCKKLKIAKTNELEYLYNPNTENNRNKNLSKQWNMAIRSLEEGIEDLQSEAELEMNGDNCENQLLKLNLLEKELQILKMRFDRLMQENVPLAYNPNWAKLSFQVRDNLLTTQTALVKDALEPMRDLCPNRIRCANCKSKPMIESPLLVPCVLNGKVADSLGDLLRVGFLLLLKHEDTRLRLESINVFRSVFLDDNSTSSDVVELTKMKSEDFKAKAKLLPQYSSLLELVSLLVLAIKWLVNITETALIKMTKCLLYYAEGTVVPGAASTGFELSFLGERACAGIIFEILHLVMICLRGDFHDYRIHLWKFDMDTIKPLARLSLYSPTVSIVDKQFLELAFRLLDRTWFNKDWAMTEPVKVARPGEVEPCSLCAKPGREYYICLDRRDGWEEHVSPADFDRWPVVRRWACTLNCNTNILSVMLPTLNLLREGLNAVSWDNELTTDFKAIYLGAWGRLGYTMLRHQLVLAMIDKNLCIESGRLIRLSEAGDKKFKDKFWALQNNKEIIEYVNNMLVHDDSFPCEHHTVWTGAVDLDKTEKIIGNEEDRLGTATFELSTCPSVDMKFIDHQDRLAADDKLPWTWKGEVQPTAVAFPLELGSLTCSYLKEECWKLAFKGDLSGVNRKYYGHAEGVLIVFSPDFNMASTRALVLVKNHEARWVAFVPREAKDLWDEMKSSKHTQDSITVLPSTVLRAEEIIALLETDNAKFLTRKACFQDKSIRDAFNKVHKRSSTKSAKNGATTSPPSTHLGAATKPFAASHLVGCPHKFIWRGTATMMGLTWGTQVRKVKFSAWAFECEDTMRIMTKNPTYVQRSPPSGFWSNMPDELTLIQTYTLDLGDLIESMFDVGYSFVMDIGTIPLEFMGGLEEDPNFLVSAFLMEKKELDYCMMVRLVRSVGKVVATVFKPDGTETSAGGTSKYSLGTKLWELAKFSVKRHGFKGTEDLFKRAKPNECQLIEITSGPINKVRTELRLPNLNPRPTVPDNGIGHVLWTGPMHFFFLFPNSSDTVCGMERYASFLNEEKTPDGLEMQNSRYDMYFSDQVGAYKNSAFLTDTNHQAYGLEGCILGKIPVKDFNFFNVKSSKHTFVALRVSKKLADTVLFRRFKKCWIFTMHMHDNQFIYQDLRRHGDCYWIGFFLPQGVTVPNHMKNIEEFADKFLILKFEDRMGILVAYYQREQAKRVQLVNALMARDPVSLSAHLHKFAAKKKEAQKATQKKEEDFPNLIAESNEIQKYLEERKKDGVYSDVSVTRKMVGNYLSVSYRIERELPDAADEDATAAVLNALNGTGPSTPTPKPQLKRVKLDKKPTRLTHVNEDGSTVVEDTESGERTTIPPPQPKSSSTQEAEVTAAAAAGNPNSPSNSPFLAEAAAAFDAAIWSDLRAAAGVKERDNAEVAASEESKLSCYYSADDDDEINESGTQGAAAASPKLSSFKAGLEPEKSKGTIKVGEPRSDDGRPSSDEEEAMEGRTKKKKEKSVGMCHLCCKYETELGYKFKKCSSCKFARYCSKDHQLEDWDDHKLHCQDLANMLERRRERKEARREVRRARREAAAAPYGNSQAAADDADAADS